MLSKPQKVFQADAAGVKKSLAGDPVGRQSIGAADTPQAEESIASVGSGGGLGWGCLGASEFRRRSSWDVHGDFS